MTHVCADGAGHPVEKGSGTAAEIMLKLAQNHLRVCVWGGGPWSQLSY
jgi:hypothetical protein